MIFLMIPQNQLLCLKIQIFLIKIKYFLMEVIHGSTVTENYQTSRVAGTDIQGSYTQGKFPEGVEIFRTTNIKHEILVVPFESQS